MKAKLSTGLVTITAICLVMFGALIVPKLHADENDKLTKLTFSEPVQVPGMTLPAGTYVFKLADSESDRNIVQIFNADQTQLITTILAITDYRMKTPDKTIVRFDERPSGQPEALRTWFYPGDNVGVEFVYPKQKAVELAQSNQQPVLSMADDTASDNESVKAAMVTPVAPPAVAAVDNTQDQQPTLVAASEQLPQTASSTPLLALGAILCLVGAFALGPFAMASK